MPGLPQWEPAEFDYDPGAIVRVSVDLRGGKASVRLRDPGGSDAQFGPDSALIAGKGVSTATFLVAGDDDQPGRSVEAGG